MRWVLGVALALASTPVLAGVTRSWAIALQPTPPADAANAPPPLADKTVREVLRLSVGGDRLRLVLDNHDSATPLSIDHIELADGAGSHTVTFGGKRAVVIPAHAPMLSDWVAMPVKGLAQVQVSFHVATGQSLGAFHSYGAAKTQIAPGDQTDAAQLHDEITTERRFVVAGVDVEARGHLRSLVTFGDSITDGVRASTDSNQRWPDQLAARLQSLGMNRVGVANLGISGNRMLLDGSGQSALVRFDRDVVAVAGVSHVIVLEGVNDIGSAWREKRHESFDTDALIEAYRQMILRGQAHGIKVILGTILPFKGAPYWSEWGEAQRQKVNAWIIGQKIADGVVDFDAVMRDPADPLVMNPVFDAGDHLHPNDKGFAAMASAVPLALLQ
jgi:lysophospholipase L1-like esterase